MEAAARHREKMEAAAVAREAQEREAEEARIAACRQVGAGRAGLGSLVDCTT